VLWRLTREGRDLMERGDPSVAQLARMEAEVRENRAVLTAAPFVPAGAALDALRAAATRCAGCDLVRHASQTVFSRGPADARIALVGEQPGDQEDRKGAPFVGPAGEVLDRALAEVGLARETLYVTNAVKHFKFTPRGKRRIHQTPGPADIAACRPWIEAELELLHPEVLVCLGATASRALIGPAFRLMQQRGTFLETRWAARTIATFHPSAVLRGEDEAAQARLYGMLRDDLRLVADTTKGFGVQRDKETR
jgi:DNA polymerase